jgi:NADPH-dependent 2,4-dienoyl-CoA reductase/sulfur reductase-like enzyme
MYDVIVIGGGPAGMAAACAAHDSGLRNILIIERDVELGGILNQCIHNGFGLGYFKEQLTGPEYASRFIDRVNRKGIQVMLDTMVLDLSTEEPEGGKGPLRKFVTVVGKETGFRKLEAKSVILAMGCRERTRGAINTPGMRPAGVLTAGAAQRYVNVDGYMPGKKVVILGSGDIGLIMARRMTLEGAKVLACVEVMPYCGGLARNVVQCLDDFGIPLYLSHTVTDIKGRDRIEQITHDHSLVEEMVRAGELRPEQARNHPKKNIITRAIGEEGDPQIDFFDVALNRGDIVLLCSDGLTNMVEDERIFQIVHSCQTLQEAGKKLIDAANNAGGKDNISVVLAKF